MVCENVGVKTYLTINKKEPFLKRRTEKDIRIEKRISVELMSGSRDDGKMAVPSRNVN